MNQRNWYCKDCRCNLDDDEVTFFEKCTYCLNDVESIEPKEKINNDNL